jgi:hypothetical protein
MPFTTDEFLNVFEQYNLWVWPMQLILNLLAIVAFWFLVFGKKNKSKVINAILVFLWLWMGMVYHLLFFSEINKAAYIFGFLFLVQSFLFAWYGLIKAKNIKYQFRLDVYGVLGLLFIIYALIVYPILSIYFGHEYPKMPTFGLPCPTVIFTIGILLFAFDRIPGIVILIPFLWSLIGFFAAVNLTIKEDFGLLIAGILGTAVLLFFRRKTIYEKNS